MSSNLTHSDGFGTGTGNATLLADPSLCTLQTCDLSLASYLYLPTVPGNVIFAAIMGACIVGQIGLGIRYKIWGYMIAMILGLAMEAIGYVGRILLHNNPFDNNYFLISLVCLTIAPACLTAAIYLCLSRIVVVYGEELSRFKPRTYTIVFCSCDLVSLVLQALGGAIASGANTKSSSDMGRNIMMVGLAFQVFSLLLFGAACGEFAYRVKSSPRTWKAQYADLINSRLFKLFLVGLFVASVTILIRSTYRVIELSGGFNSSLFESDEIVFMLLEGTMISIAVITLTALHPGHCFQGAWHSANFKFRPLRSSKLASSQSDLVSHMEQGQTSYPMGNMK